MSNLQGKISLVTGAGRGIGHALAMALAGAGCDVAVIGRHKDEIEPVAAAIRESGHRSIALPCDIADSAQVAATYATIVQQLGGIDILINNAGILTPMGATASIDAEQWIHCINTNLCGSFRWIHTCLPAMLQQNWGRIINITSTVADGTGMPHGNAYSVTKAGLESMIRNLAHEISGSGVTVNAVRPGNVDTYMQTYVRALPAEQAGEARNFFTDIYEKGALLKPEQPAHLIINLLQGDSSGEVVSIYEPRGQELLSF